MLAGVIGVGAYAFTASNTVPAQSAGGGSAAVTGYTEAGYTYTFTPSGEETTGVTVLLTGEQEPSDVEVALTPATPTAAGEWTDCPTANISEVKAKEYKAVCEFGTPIPDGEGDLLSVTAVSEGKVVIG